MPTTGLELSRELDLQIDKDYSGYLSPAKKNRLFLMAYINLLEKKYNGLDRQQVYDELTHFLKVDKEYEVRNGKIYTSPLQISVLTYAPGTSTITTVLDHGLLVGDVVQLNNVQGVSGISGNFTIQQVLTPKQFTISQQTFSGVYVPNTGNVTSDKIIFDYHHLLTVECIYTRQYIKNKIVDATNATPIVIKVEGRTDLRSGEKVTITGVTGNLSANGIYYLKKLYAYEGYSKYSLYQDKDLTIPVAGFGPYNSGGEIKKEFDNYAVQRISDQKISIFSDATVEFPKFQVSEGYLVFEPAPNKIRIDYMTEGQVSPTPRIDVNDNATDLELYYNKKFLVRLVNEAADLFSLQQRDLSQYQAQTQETIENP